MDNLIVWVFITWTGILLGGLIVLCLPVDAGQAFHPKPVVLVSEKGPEMPALWSLPLPAHVIDWRQPLCGEDNETVRPYTPEAVERPLQRERRAAAFAAQLDLPDPLHYLDDAIGSDGALIGRAV